MKDPYLFEDMKIIKNIANIKDQKKLDDYETIVSFYIECNMV